MGTMPRRAVVLLLALLCPAVLLTGCGPSRQSRREDGPEPVLSGEPLCEASPRSVSIRFRCNVPLPARVVAGYRPDELGSIESRRSEAATAHHVQLGDLRPGRLFYRVELLPARGNTLTSRVYNVLVPGADGALPRTVYGGSKPARPAPDLAPRRSPAVSITALRSAYPEERPEPDSSYDPPLEGKPVGEANAASAGAYEIGYAFGPGSLNEGVRRELKDRIASLEADWKIEERAETALELGRCYLRLHGDMKALAWLKRAIDADPKLYEAHRLRLLYYKKYGMGWKIRECYGAMRALRPGDATLAAAAARDEKRYGSHRFLGEPVKVRIGERTSRLGTPPWEKEGAER